MNRFIALVLLISSIACAENGFWKEFDCPNKKLTKKHYRHIFFCRKV
ncbi:hypothetical protein SAMN05720759_103123 [Fibrobacter sp. UWB12]|nr:hypothetical protein SAMN05720759_103123 [Fibrobacter sp. UWB12]